MRAKSLTFTVLADLAQLFRGGVWVSVIVELMKHLDVQPSAVRVTLFRMVNEGLVTRHRSGARAYYALSPDTVERLGKLYDRVYPSRPLRWDGSWSVVSYTIPETMRRARDRFRRELTLMGYGPVSSSTWVSVHDAGDEVARVTARLKLQRHVSIFTSVYRGPETVRQFAAKCWDFATIGKTYQEFVDRYQPEMERFRAEGPPGDRDCFVQRTLLVHQWRKYLYVAPRLPPELQPPDWVGERAGTLFMELYRFLTPGTNRFVHSILARNEPLPAHSPATPEAGG